MGGIFFCLHINWPTFKGGGGGELIRVSLRSHKYRNVLNLCI